MRAETLDECIEEAVRDRARECDTYLTSRGLLKACNEAKRMIAKSFAINLTREQFENWNYEVEEEDEHS